jgi:hypothetical protein
MLATLAYHDRDVEEELAYFDLGRRQIARILRASPAATWERIGVVGDRVDKTVAQMVNGAVEHVAHHQLLERARPQNLDDWQGRAGDSSNRPGRIRLTHRYTDICDFGETQTIRL